MSSVFAANALTMFHCWSNLRSCDGGLGYHQPQRCDWLWAASCREDQVLGNCSTSFHPVSNVSGTFLIEPIQPYNLRTVRLCSHVVLMHLHLGRPDTDTSPAGLQLVLWGGNQAFQAPFERHRVSQLSQWSRTVDKTRGTKVADLPWWCWTFTAQGVASLIC